MRTLIAVSVVLFLTPGASLAFQGPVGERVRVEVPHPFEGTLIRVGTLEGVDDHTVWVRVNGQILRLDRSQANPSLQAPGNKSKAGALWGVGLGMFAGGLYSYASYDAEYYDIRRCTQRPGAMLGSLYGASCRTVGQGEEGSRTADTVVGASVGLLAGGLIGYLLGTAVHQWVPLAEHSVQVEPSGIRVSLNH